MTPYACKCVNYAYACPYIRTQYKAPEKDETVKKMEDDKQELVAQTEAAMKETENVRQALQRENQQKVEQLNVRFCVFMYIHMKYFVSNLCTEYIQ